MTANFNLFSTTTPGCYLYVPTPTHALLNGHGYGHTGVGNENGLLNESDFKVRNKGESKIYPGKPVSNDNEKDDVKLATDTRDCHFKKKL